MGIRKAARKVKKVIQVSPGRSILLSLIFTIFIGTVLLSMPIAHTRTLPFIDVLFTSASVTCVTGLETVPFESFTTLGHIIILLLIQIGGLGIITMSLFLMSFFVDLGIATQWMAGQLLELKSWKDVKKILAFIIALTFAFECAGALLIFASIYHQYPIGQAIFYSIFHAVASFCNAGITPFPYSMQTHIAQPLVLIVTMILMLSGGLGFIAWREIIQRLSNRKERKRNRQFSLHTRLVLYTTLLLVVGSLLVWGLLEWNAAFAGLPLPLKLLNTVFNAISSRGPGFYTVHISQLHIATVFTIMITAFIGSSPGSTGSGIKTTTFAIFLATIRATIMGRSSVELLGRRIAHEQINKAMAIISLSLTWIAIATFCLLISETEYSFLPIFFEVISAIATLGISMGITASLSLFSKTVIIATMIIGRIGSLTLMLALRKRREGAEFSYPEERVMMS